MNFEDYYRERNELWKKQPYNKETSQLLYASNSLGGELGEFQNVVKKVYRDDDGDPTGRMMDLVSEMGDILWYWCHVCEILDLEPKDIMKINIEKLKRRYRFEK